MRQFETLEGRTLFANFVALDAEQLLAHIAAANASPEADRITVAAGSTLTLPGETFGSVATIEKTGGALTVVGNGSTLQLVNAYNARFFDVPAGASLTLTDLTLQGGRTNGSGNSAFMGTAGAGGAIRSAGSLTLERVTLQNNIARGREGTSWGSPVSVTDGQGGAISSTGSLRMTGCTLRNNHAIGGTGSNNLNNRNGGNGLGGAVYLGGGTAFIRDCTITNNRATAGAAGLQGKPGKGRGGGIYIATRDTTSLNAFTRANTTSNFASTSADDIFGRYSLVA